MYKIRAAVCRSPLAKTLLPPKHNPAFVPCFHTKPSLRQSKIMSDKPTADSASDDITVLVKADHDSVRDFYQRYQKATNTDEKNRLCNSIIREISVHSSTEEIVVYPVFEKNFEGGKNLADNSRKEHQVVKDLLYEVDTMSRDEPTFEDILSRCYKEFDHHAKEEEQEHLPKLRQLLSMDDLQKLGREYNRTKALAPTRPHPAAPDKPPAETVAGVGAAAVDKALDLGREFAEPTTTKKEE